MSVCVGCGLEVDPNTGKLQVNTDGTSITCGVNGLQANFPAALGGSQCVDVANGQVSIKRSAIAHNGITCQADGLYSACPASIVGIANTTVAGTWTPMGINDLGAHLFDADSACNVTPFNDCVGTVVGSALHWCNDLGCQIEGMVTVRCFPGEVINASVGFEAVVFLQISIDGSTWAPATPGSHFSFFNDGPDVETFYLGNLNEQNYLNLAEGQCVTYLSRVTMNVLVGTATWQTAPNWEYYWHLTQTACDCA